MKKINTAPISGMQEFLPDTQALFDNIKEKIANAYRLHGFQHIETPTIDRNEILFAKAGGDTETQIYRVIKTDEEAKDSDQSLRFDHTVPLARYIVEHESALSFPFRVTQIGKNFRGERAQKGRFREFYQCDVDVIGRGELPLSYDAEVIACFYGALQSFVKTPVKIRLNNRQFLTSALKELGVKDAQLPDVYNIIDHAEKVPAKKTESALKNLKLTEETVVKITTLIDAHGSIKVLKDLPFIDVGKCEGFKDLEFAIAELKALGLEGAAEIDLKIVRGLNYYTGTVFEANLPEYPTVGSIGGGGRYDNLTGFYTDQKFPGVGASIGLSRLFYILQSNNLLDDVIVKPVAYALIPLGDSARKTAYSLAGKLRAAGRSVDVISVEKKFGDLMKHAAAVAKNGIVIGPDEVASGKFVVKNFDTREQKPLDLSALDEAVAKLDAPKSVAPKTSAAIAKSE